MEINNFVFERRDRSHKKCSGSLVYLNNGIMYERLSNLESDDIESIWLKVKPMHSKSFILGCIYRPPYSKQMWIYTFEQQFNMADTLKLYIYIYTVGVIYINISTVTGFQNTKCSNVITYYNITQLITHPTRVIT